MSSVNVDEAKAAAELQAIEQTPPPPTTFGGKFSDPETISGLDLLKPNEVEQARQIANMTRLEAEPALIADFGAETEALISAAAKPFLAQIKTKDAGEIGVAILALTTATNGLDFSLLKEPQPPSGLKKFFSGSWNAVEEAKRQIDMFFGQYDTLDGKITEIRETLNKNQRELRMDMMFGTRMMMDNLSHYRKHLIYIAAGELILKRLTRDLEELQEDARIRSLDIEEQAVLQNLEMTKQMFSIRVHDLKLVLFAVELTTINLFTLSKANLLQLLEIKRVLGAGLAIFEQSVAAQVIAFRNIQRSKDNAAVRGMINASVERAAIATQQAAFAVADSANQGVVSVESLQKATSTFIDTIGGVRERMEQGDVNRQKEVQVLDDSRRKLEAAVVSTDKGAARYLTSGK
jgi:uncharacterized protein YaaN involved in tellurite resistance